MKIKKLADVITLELEKRIIGNKLNIELLIITLLSKGHVLLEGVPGIAKSYLAATLSEVLGVGHKRIQFTPDLLPADITGSSIFNPKSESFNFIKGPIFTNVLLCDEISRAPPKTQAALLEAMAEVQVSFEGVTRVLDKPFMVLATQNPIEQVGVYPLPEAQLDRFMVRVILKLPGYADELEILKSKREKFIPDVNTVTNVEEIILAQDLIEKIEVSDQVLSYIARLVLATRFSPALILGGSPRASLALMTMARARAAIHGRSFVEPDDVKLLFYYVLNHRIILTPQAEVDQIPVEQILQGILQQVPVAL